jgi:hypothetical protein
MEGKTALYYAKDNKKLKGTDALKQLEEASRNSRRVSREGITRHPLKANEQAGLARKRTEALEASQGSRHVLQ